MEHVIGFGIRRKRNIEIKQKDIKDLETNKENIPPSKNVDKIKDELFNYIKTGTGFQINK